MELESEARTPIKREELNILDANEGNSLTTFSFATIPILLLSMLHFGNPCIHFCYTGRRK
jgi:hypothetical protein